MNVIYVRNFDKINSIILTDFISIAADMSIYLLNSLSDKTYFRNISLKFEAETLCDQIIFSFWNLKAPPLEC